MPIAELPTLNVHYAQLASAQPTGALPPQIVLVHGLATSMAFWFAGAARLLTPLGEVTMFDLRGHGRSSMPASGYGVAEQAEDMMRLLDLLGIERAHVIAHSFGGQVALAVALRQPERFASLVLAEVRIRALQPAASFAAWPQWPRLRQRLAEAEMEIDENDPEGGLVLVTALARQMANGGGRDAAGAIIPGAPRLGGRRSARQWLQLIERTSAYAEIAATRAEPLERLVALPMPILGLYGEHSMVLASGAAFARLCPRFRLHVVPGAGHFFPLTRPREFARRARRFIRSHQVR